MKGCEFILSTGERLDYNQMRQRMLENYAELSSNGTLLPPQESKETGDRLEQSGKKARKTYESIITRSAELTEQQKDLAKKDPNRYYTPVSMNDSKNAAEEIVKQIGLENAVELASSKDESIPEVVKVAILGQAASEYAKQSKTSLEVNAHDKFLESLEALAKKSTELGRAIAQLKSVYQLSGLGLVAKLEKAVQEKTNNKYTEEEINKRVAEVRAAIEKEFGNIKIDFEKKITDEKDQEIKSTINKLVSQRSEKLNKALNVVQRLRAKNKGKLYDATLGIPMAILDAGLAMLEYSLMAGISANTAIENAVDKMKELMAKENKTLDEKKFRDFVKSQFGDLFNELVEEETISTKPTEDVVQKAKEKIEKQSEKIDIAGQKVSRSAVAKILKIFFTTKSNESRIDEILNEIKDAGFDIEYDKENDKYILSSTSKEVTKEIKELLKEYNKLYKSQSKLDEIIKEGLGFKLSQEDAKLAEELADYIADMVTDKSVYYIKHQYEEIIQYLVKKNGVNLKYFTIRDGMVASQLSSLWNAIQNATGFAVIITRLFITALKTKNVTPFKVFSRELNLAKQEASTIFFGGRVSRGVSYKDLIKSKTPGEVGVRYLEYFQSKNPFWKFVTSQKYIGRFLEAVDTFSSAASAGLNDYLKTKMYVEKFYPELSDKEKAKLEFDIMYGETTQADIDRATKDLKSAGVKNPTKAEINRTIYERLVRARDAKIKEEYDIFYAKKLQEAEQYVKDNNLPNTPKDIANWASLWAGEYDTIVGEAQEKAQIDTGKMSTVGVASAVSSVLGMFQGGINKAIKESARGDSAKARTAKAADLVLNRMVFPFAESIARWTELGLELTPYGALKGGAYKIAALNTKDTKKSERLKEMGTDFMLRSMLGLLYTIPAIAANLLGDDDEEEEVIGMEKKAKYGLEQVASAGLPKQSIKISETRTMPIQLLGTVSTAYMWYADVIKRVKESIAKNEALTPEKRDNIALQIVYAGALTSFSVTIETSWLQSAQRYGNITMDNQKPLASGIGRLLGSVLPWNRFQQEMAIVIDPQSKRQEDFQTNVINQFSITKAFTPGKPNVDYRGREYDTGDIFVNSIDGLRKFIMGKPKYRDEIDAWLTNMKYAVSTSYRASKSEELGKYHIVNDEEIRNLTDEEYYDFRVLAANKFNKRLEEYYNSNEWDKLEEDVEKRNVVSALLTDAKEEAIAELNGFDKYKKYEKETKKMKEEEGEDEGKSPELIKQIKKNKKRYKGY
jgi:hypothetical protein